MHASLNHHRVDRGKLIVKRLLAASAVMGTLVTTVTGCDLRSYVDAHRIVDELKLSPGMITRLIDETDVACADPAPCEQKLVSDKVTVWKFGSRDDASSFAATLEADHHVSDFIVLEYAPDGYTETQKRMAEQVADEMNTQGFGPK